MMIRSYNSFINENLMIWEHWYINKQLLFHEDTMKLSDFLEEAAIMKEMKHPNLVQVT